MVSRGAIWGVPAPAGAKWGNQMKQYDVIVEDGTAVGVRARHGHELTEFRGKTVVDENLETCRCQNLYICDASVVPEALDRPVVLMMIGLGRRLAGHLLGK